MSSGTKRSGVAVRVAAGRVLLSIVNDYQQLDDALTMHLTDLGRKDAALVQAICYGVMRHYHELLYWVQLQAGRPAGKIKPPVRVLLLVGLYQLRFMRVAAHAAINETVEAAGSFNVTRAKGFINAVLRGLQRRWGELEDVRSSIEADEVAYYSHPQWMLERLRRDWPQHWEQIVTCNNRQAPMTLRVNSNETSVQKYRGLLEDRGITAEPHPVAAEAITLSRPIDVDALPGFSHGQVSVQDAAAQLAVPLLEIGNSHRVLDACAAPGGKTAHILQWSNPRVLVAVDNHPGRLQKVDKTLQRIRRQAQVVRGDTAHPDEWWDGESFDRILLDAPCSASGVIRRHPDIKYLRSESTLNKIVRRQQKILNAVWQLLKPGGMLLYVTCSVFRIENQEQVDVFLQSQAAASLVELDVPWGLGKTGRQVLPCADDMDGFYFALLKKA